MTPTLLRPGVRPGVVQQQLLAGPVDEVYIEEDFTDTTSGDMTTNNMQVDELGNGWVHHTNTTPDEGADDWHYGASGGQVGVEYDGAAAAAGFMAQTDGREDVEVWADLIVVRGPLDDHYPAICVRGHGGDYGDSIAFKFRGPASDVDLHVFDGNYGGGAGFDSWDLSALAETCESGDRLLMVFHLVGDDLTLHAMRNASSGGPWHDDIDDTITLNGSAATAHGAGSGADWYGFGDRVPGGNARRRYMHVKSIV